MGLGGCRNGLKSRWNLEDTLNFNGGISDKITVEGSNMCFPLRAECVHVWKARRKPNLVT